MTTYTDEYRAKARERMRRRRAQCKHPCAECSTLVSASATRCAKHAALHREEQLAGQETERGKHYGERKAQGIKRKVKTMSVHRPTPPKHQAISSVMANIDLSPARRWPGGLLAACLTLDNKNLLLQAAIEMKVGIVAVQTDIEHFAAYGMESGDYDYGALLNRFQSLQVEAFAARRAT